MENYDAAISSMFPISVVPITKRSFQFPLPDAYKFGCCWLRPWQHLGNSDVIQRGLGGKHKCKASLVQQTPEDDVHLDGDWKALD